MSTLYTVWPLDSEMKAWLESQDIALPDDATARWPSREEVVALLSALRDFKIRYAENGPNEIWDALVREEQDDAWWTLLQAKPKDGSDAVIELSFEGGEPALIIAILRDLSDVTGPLVLMADADALVVGKHVPYEALVHEWVSPEPDLARWHRLLDRVPGTS